MKNELRQGSEHGQDYRLAIQRRLFISLVALSAGSGKRLSPSVL
ncbi:uncharacterized protein METZ01_LOCUS227601 [marine metagenome]|uniref:Uncharacterized protein n=1 Tax=marine metagenome TaxID=408172 RepID=A0A382GJD4_9ZZZZ